jgi:hypothetical protein
VTEVPSGSASGPTGRAEKGSVITGKVEKGSLPDKLDAAGFDGDLSKLNRVPDSVKSGGLPAEDFAKLEESLKKVFKMPTELQPYPSQRQIEQSNHITLDPTLWKPIVDKSQPNSYSFKSDEHVIHFNKDVWDCVEVASQPPQIDLRRRPQISGEARTTPKMMDKKEFEKTMRELEVKEYSPPKLRQE